MTLKIENTLILLSKLCLVLFYSLLASCETSESNLQQKAYQKNSYSDYVKEVDIKFTSEKLDLILPPLMAGENIRGMSLSLINHSNVVLSKSLGIRSTRTQKRVNNDTVYEFASLSKPLFSLAVLQLAEKGIIDLDKPLYEYLEYREVTDDDRYELITARIVLSHRTGFPNWARGEQVDLAFEPGERFQYSGEGYLYLQKVLEKITGRSLQKIVEEEIFIPLQMTHSSFIWKDKYQNNMAEGHSRKGEFDRKIRQKTEGVSASSLISNVTDYSKFLQYVLKEYKKNNPIIKRMVTPIIPVKDDGKWGKLSWGLGWGIEETSQGKNIWHWGNNGEFRSLVVANLEKGIGLVYVSNSASGLEPIAYIIQNTIGGIHPLTRFRYVY